jgi:hypothetical protein
MAWSNSKIFSAFVADQLDGTASFDLDGDTIKVALYDNTITPDNTVTSANTAYDVGQWASANEVSEAGQWEAAGEALTTPDVTWSTTTITFDAADTSSDTAATLADVHGCLIYSDTVTTPVADQGICYIYFGGANSVSGGTLTVQWNASGIFTGSTA